MTPRTVFLVPHTHWDREWYLPFEHFRDKLVTTMDLLLEILERDPAWTHFHLDGQTALIDDYLEVRPERQAAIRQHVAEGRLSCGPWVTLVDQFLVSGESIIRNLEDGIRRAGQLGGATMLGYLPDQFGHIGQMPQILAGAGITDAVVWRGVPSAVTGSSFRWVAPDGSSVLAHYLPFGYGQGRSMETDPTGFVARLTAEQDRWEPFLGDGEPMVLTVGDDHEAPDPNLTTAVRSAAQEGWSVQITSLAASVERSRAHKTHPVEIHGELRSAARANLLPNTYSVRPLQKVARARAENLLERYAGPLAALVGGDERDDDRLAAAWNLLHLNGAHDSVCGCSTDEVADAVDRRTAEAEAIALSVARGVLLRLAKAEGLGGTLRFNPSPFEREGVPGLGWSTFQAPSPRAQPAALAVEGDTIVAEGIRLHLEDTADEGDLYNFCPASDPEIASNLEAADGTVIVRGSRFGATLTATRTDDLVVFEVDVDNRAPDHRLRVLVELPRAAATTTAGAPFEVVTRPVIGEGGPEEKASPWWPARGFVLAGGGGVFADGVIEYELIPPGTLAVTLMRCTGTISRPVPIPTRLGPAGPDVPTPAAQLIGRTRLRFAVARDGVDPISVWERYSLGILDVVIGGKGIPRKGSLLGLKVPALSSIGRTEGKTWVRFWNPHDGEQLADIGGRVTTVGPHRIETLEIPGGTWNLQYSAPEETC